MKKCAVVFSAIVLLGLMTACDGVEKRGLDLDVRTALSAAKMEPLDPGPVPDLAQVELGRALFFDKILSGNKDTSCATCHHPLLHTGDGLCVSIGTGGHGLGTGRSPGEGRGLIPRNAPELFNRGSKLWTTMFWDSRVAGKPYEGEDLISPAGSLLPPGMPSVLAVQAMFPPTSDAEMRGSAGDLDANGNVNELANIDGADVAAIWAGLMDRLMAIPEYVALFEGAFPGVSSADFNFGHVGQAIAAFEVEAFTMLDTPFDRYLEGNNSALSAEQKRGALLYFGKARCAKCHSGPLLTDQEHHNIAVPQMGPGKGEESPFDFGRFRETADPAEKYAFRTPPLRNVALTGPYMHNGAYLTLEEAVRHHLDPQDMLSNYDPGNIPPMFADTVNNDANTQASLIANMSDKLKKVDLDEDELADLMSFLHALTDPAAGDLDKVTPWSVPSNLPLAD